MDLPELRARTAADAASLAVPEPGELQARSRMARWQETLAGIPKDIWIFLAAFLVYRVVRSGPPGILETLVKQGTAHFHLDPPSNGHYNSFAFNVFFP